MSIRRSVATGAFTAAVALSCARQFRAGPGGRATASSAGPGGRTAPAGGPPPAAQGRGGGGGGFGGGAPPFTPAPDAKDMKAVLYIGRGTWGCCGARNEPELVGTLQYEGEGHVQGRRATPARRRSTTSGQLQIPGSRTEIECKRANGSVYKNVETFAGRYVWDEIVPARSSSPAKARPRRSLRRSRRLIRLWPTPTGVAKAAIAAAAGVTLTRSLSRIPPPCSTSRPRPSEGNRDPRLGREKRDHHVSVPGSPGRRQRSRSTRNTCRNASW